MKATLYVLFFLLPLSLIARDNDNRMNCGKFHTGKFVMEDKQTGKTTIQRYESVQIETMEKYNFTVELHIHWVDDCTYQLTFSRIVKDPDNNARDLNRTMVITNSITDIKGNSYTQTTSSDSNPKTLRFTLTKVE